MSRVAKQFLLAGFMCFSAFGAMVPASAQTSSCQDIQKILEERKGYVDQLNKMGSGGKKLDARAACTLFTKMTTNGQTASKWLDENKAWCQVPEDFVEGFVKDHKHVSDLKGQACKAAAQMNQAEKRAREGGGGGLLGGGGLSGEYKMPKGAL